MPEDYATVHEAMKEARDGDVILIGAGEHMVDASGEGGVALKSNVTLRGTGHDRTILWSTKGSVVYASEVRNAIIEDLRLEGRPSPEGALSPLWISDATVTLRNCHIRGGGSSGITSISFTAQNELVVLDSLIEANREHGILVTSSGATRVWIERTQIQQNDGAGIAFQGVTGANLRILESLIADNKGSGIVAGDERMRGHIERSAVIRNGVDGVAVSGRRLVLQHNIFFRNRRNGILVYKTASPTITDNIIAGNGHSGINLEGGVVGVIDYPLATHNLLWDNKRGNVHGFEFDSSNIEAAPDFLDADAWDFRLAAGSPGRNAGSDGDDIGLYPRMAPPPALVWPPRAEEKGDPKAEAFRLSSIPASRGRSLAVVVGVQSYEDPAIKDLKYTDDDAERVAAFLQGQGYEVRKLVNGDAKLATMRGALLWLASARPDDRVVFYFSGHGSDEPNPLGEDQGFLLASDTRLFDGSKKQRLLPATALPLSELRRVMDNTAARRVSVLLDACFAAGAKSVSAPRRGVKSVGDSEITGGLTFGEGKVALYSSRDNEPSLEADEHRHGYFTHYLLEAWQTRRRSADDVYRHVYQGVTRDTKNAQHPRKEYSEAEGAVPIY